MSILNRQARFEYSILEEYTAGLVLFGTEVKAIRIGKCNISEAFCVFINGELFIRNMNIDIFGNSYQHEPKRDRKLLLNKKELNKLSIKMRDKGLAIVPIEVYVNNKIKIKIGLGKGKNLYDKRQTLKERDIKKQLNERFE